jgi:futalosine hydrolase
MSLRILLVTATNAEADTFQQMTGIKSSPSGYKFDDHEIISLVTGVGTVATAWTMTKWISSGLKPDLAVNIGIAGSYRNEILNGDVVVPVSDCFADAGIETPDGFLTLAEAGLEDPDRFPFRNGRILADNRFIKSAVKHLKPVNAITVNTITGTREAIDKLVKKYQPDIETMEGAAFFYVCCRENIPFLAVRSVSNKVEPRDRKKWEMELALSNLQKKLKELFPLFK